MMRIIKDLIQLAFAFSCAAMMTGCASSPAHLQATSRLSQPPPGKALINFHRPSNYGGMEKYAIFDGDGNMLIDLPGRSEYQHVCAPGKHVFIGWADQVSVVEAEVEADKIYDAMVDIGMGWVRANIKLIPLNQGDPRRAELAEFERRATTVYQLNRNDHVAQYEAAHKGRIEQIRKDFLAGAKSDRVRRLKPDDAR